MFSGCWVAAFVSWLDIVVEYWAILLPSVFAVQGFAFIPGRLVGYAGVRRERSFRCVWIWHENMRKMMCCHILVWHHWVGCAHLSCCPFKVEPQVSLASGRLCALTINAGCISGLFFWRGVALVCLLFVFSNVLSQVQRFSLAVLMFLVWLWWNCQWSCVLGAVCCCFWRLVAPLQTLVTNQSSQSPVCRWVSFLSCGGAGACIRPG